MIVNEISLVIQNKNSLARKLTAGALFLFPIGFIFSFLIYKTSKDSSISSQELITAYERTSLVISCFEMEKRKSKENPEEERRR